MKTKKTTWARIAPVVLAALVVGCGVETESVTDGDETAAHDDEGESVSREASPLIVKSPTPFCLPGEVRKCTLGPPPVCRCVPVVVDPVLVAW